MPDPTPAPDANLDPAALRGQAIAALHDIIYAAPPEQEPVGPTIAPEHDPALRPRAEAVDLLGRFPDAAAAHELSKLLLRGERDIPGPAGRWLRDTALLTLLRSSQLPRKEVDRALGRAYSFVRHPAPWEWSSVYDELPLLARYHKLGVFFRAFWLWPLLIFAVPTLVEIAQLTFNLGEVIATGPFSTLAVVFGIGGEIYLAHQIIVALLTRLQGPPLQLPGSISTRQKGWFSVGLTLLMASVPVVIVVLIMNGELLNQKSASLFLLLLILLVVPLLLLPMFMLAHDLEQEVRYQPKDHSRRLRAWALILRRTTDVNYLLFLPALAAGVFTLQKELPIVAILFLLYLFVVVPLLVTGGLRLLSRVLARRDAGAAPLPPAA